MSQGDPTSFKQGLLGFVAFFAVFTGVGVILWPVLGPLGGVIGFCFAFYVGMKIAGEW